MDRSVDTYGHTASAAKLYTGIRGYPLNNYTDNAASAVPFKLLNLLHCHTGAGVWEERDAAAVVVPPPMASELESPWPLSSFSKSNAYAAWLAARCAARDVEMAS